MKILIPTAKEMIIPNESYPFTELDDISSIILDELSTKSVEDLMDIYKITEKQAVKEKERINKIKNKTALTYNAIDLFNGLMYRNIDRNNFDEYDKNYMKANVFITSSFYGIINVYEKISEHRLDFLQKLYIDNKNLKKLWQKSYDGFLEKEDFIISLLSSEFEEVFSKKIRENMYKVVFMESEKGKLKTHSTISKKARGRFLSELVKNKISNIDQIKEVSFDGYNFNAELSEERKFVFVKLKGE